MTVKLKNIEQSLKKEHQKYIDDFSSFLELSKISKSVSLSNLSNAFLKKIITEGIDSNYSKRSRRDRFNLRDEIFKLLDTIIELNVVRVDYSDISSVVMEFERSLNDSTNPDILDSFFQEVRDELRVIIDLYNTRCDRFSNLSNDDLEKFETAIICFYKSLEHAILANLQFKNLYLKTHRLLEKNEAQLRENTAQMADFSNDFEEWRNGVSDVIDETTRDIFEKTKNLEEDIEISLMIVDDKYKNIYTDFIAILGVFASFVFVMFGGFTALSKIIETLSNSSVSLPKTILVSSILFGFLITVLYSLLYWISLIIDKPIFNSICDCRPTCTNIKHLFIKHRYYLIVISSCLVMFTISSVLILLGIN